jgi:fructose-bisphosphate aldolase class II
MLVTNRELAKLARKNKRAFGSFNASNLEVIKAIVEAAKRTKSPVSIETSEGEASYIGPQYAAAIVKTAARDAGVPIALHLDHGKSVHMVLECLRAGFTSVHIDGSALPLEENIKLTKSVVKLAKKYGASVEGEIGHIEGGSSIHNKKLKPEDIEYAKPEDVKDFVRETGVDLVAVGIGSGHGLYKNEPKLDWERLKKISWITKAYLVLHGSSGLSNQTIRKAISLGITKINVNTDLRVAFAETLRKVLNSNKKEVVPYKIFPQAQEAVSKLVERKIKLFNNK